MRATRLTIFATFLVSTAIGCQSEPTVATHATDKSAEAKPTKPFVFVHFIPGFVASTNSPQFKRRGVFFAVWEDGSIVRAESEELSGQSYVRGNVTSEQIQAIRRLLDQIDFESSTGRAGFDCPVERLVFRTINEIKIEGYEPQWFPECKVPEPFRKLKQVVFNFEMTEVQKVSAERYKNYPSDWYK